MGKKVKAPRRRRFYAKDPEEQCRVISEGGLSYGQRCILQGPHHPGVHVFGTPAYEDHFEVARYGSGRIGPSWCPRDEAVLVSGTKRCGLCEGETVPLYVKVEGWKP